MAREFERGYLKKGPWSSEEDEVLMRHVSKYGPREWSSIRSKGLLPRTGKSCRLRWVNKLRPNLKTYVIYNNLSLFHVYLCSVTLAFLYFLFCLIHLLCYPMWLHCKT